MVAMTENCAQEKSTTSKMRGELMQTTTTTTNQPWENEKNHTQNHQTVNEEPTAIDLAGRAFVFACVCVYARACVYWEWPISICTHSVQYRFNPI